MVHDVLVKPKAKKKKKKKAPAVVTDSETRVATGRNRRSLHRTMNVADAITASLAAWCGQSPKLDPVTVLGHHQRSLEVIYGMSLILCRALNNVPYRRFNVDDKPPVHGRRDVKDPRTRVLSDIFDFFTPSPSALDRCIKKPVCAVAEEYYEAVHVPLEGCEQEDAGIPAAEQRSPPAKDGDAGARASSPQRREGENEGTGRSPGENDEEEDEDVHGRSPGDEQEDEGEDDDGRSSGVEENNDSDHRRSPEDGIGLEAQKLEFGEDDEE